MHLCWGFSSDDEMDLLDRTKQIFFISLLGFSTKSSSASLVPANTSAPSLTTSAGECYTPTNDRDILGRHPYDVIHCFKPSLFLNIDQNVVTWWVSNLELLHCQQFNRMNLISDGLMIAKPDDQSWSSIHNFFTRITGIPAISPSSESCIRIPVPRQGYFALS